MKSGSPWRGYPDPPGAGYAGTKARYSRGDFRHQPRWWCLGGGESQTLPGWGLTEEKMEKGNFLSLNWVKMYLSVLWTLGFLDWKMVPELQPVISRALPLGLNVKGQMVLRKHICNQPSSGAHPDHTVLVACHLCPLHCLCLRESRHIFCATAFYDPALLQVFLRVLAALYHLAFCVLFYYTWLRSRGIDWWSPLYSNNARISL